MKRLLILAVFVSIAAPAYAQPRSAIGTAKNTAATANARTEAASEQAKQAQAQPAQAGAQPQPSGSATNPAATQPADSSARSAAPAGIATATQRSVPTITREVFQYDGGGRRDPFLSLTRTGALRPHISELALTIVMVGNNDNSRGVATIVDTTKKERYQVRVGDLLGRYRVVGIDAKSVTFAIDEFGFSRQERLVIGDSTRVRN
jgi:hypothetical protein